MMDKIKNFLKKNRKIILVGAVALVVVIIVAVLASGAVYEPIDDSYFVSDGGKLVMSLTKEKSNYEMSKYESDLTYVVYYYSGDKINNIRVFYEYKDEDEAREANEHIKMDDKDWAVGRKLNGRYIIFNVTSKRWENLSVDYMRGIIQSMDEINKSTK